MVSQKFPWELQTPSKLHPSVKIPFSHRFTSQVFYSVNDTYVHTSLNKCWNGIQLLHFEGGSIPSYWGLLLTILSNETDCSVLKLVMENATKATPTSTLVPRGLSAAVMRRSVVLEMGCMCSWTLDYFSAPVYFILLCLFFCFICWFWFLPQCSGIISSSLFRNYSWRFSGNYMQCQRLTWLSSMQAKHFIHWSISQAQLFHFSLV